jgi:TM2 domain-containing membrane protein YozV
MALIQCPECATQISDVAASCPSCGYPLRAPIAKAPVLVSEGRKWSPGVAAVLSLVIPGAGQMYKGEVAKGLIWLLFIVLGYALVVIPGLVLHLCCIFAAASGDPTK